MQAAARALWQQLKAADLPREQYGTAYRILHGGLHVGAFLCHIGALPPHLACCSHPACHQQLETLTHAFVRCPAVAPAAEWVCRVFGAVTGEQPPPATAAVLLAADDPGGWAPPEELEHAWAALRVAFVHCVWQLRCRRSLAGLPFTAARVCAAVVSAVTGSIRRDWARASQSLVSLSGVPVEWFRGRDPALSVRAFQERWAHGGVLCAVHDAPAGSQGGKQMELRLSLAHPVAAPPSPDVPAPQDGGGLQPGDPPPANSAAA